MKRSGPIKTDPAKTRAWQARSKPLSRSTTGLSSNTSLSRSTLSQQGSTKPSRKKPRRNDGPWRDEVMALRGEVCRRCLSTREVQADHIVNRSQQGKSVVENGLPLCRTCHEGITENRWKYRFEWLDPDQVAWLADIGWVSWDADGRPTGRGMRYFAARSAA